MSHIHEAIRPGKFSRNRTMAMNGLPGRALNGRHLRCLLFLMGSIVFASAARGAIISQYSFTGSTLNRSATTVASDVTAGNITDAPTVNNNPTVVLARTTGVGYGTEPVLSAARANFNESSVRANVYFTFTVSPNAGNELDLSSLTFNVAQGGGTASTRDYEVRTSLDGFVSSLTGIVLLPTVRPTFTPVLVNLSAAQFQDLTSPLTFQVRFFTPTVSQNVDFDDITINGAVVAVPEPTTLILLAIAGGWIFRRRQREV
jgi:hypothetical protein